MGFMYGLLKLFVAPKTIKKFHPMSNGANLASEFGNSKVKGLGALLPEEYGGKGGSLKSQGKEPLLGEADAKSQGKETAVKEADAQPPAKEPAVEEAGTQPQATETAVEGADPKTEAKET